MLAQMEPTATSTSEHIVHYSVLSGFLQLWVDLQVISHINNKVWDSESQFLDIYRLALWFKSCWYVWMYEPNGNKEITHCACKEDYLRGTGEI